MKVRRNDGRICDVYPHNTPWNVVGGRRGCTEFDDVHDGMGVYSTHGGVVTFCRQYALYDAQTPEGLTTCLGCIAEGGPNA